MRVGSRNNLQPEESGWSHDLVPQREIILASQPNNASVHVVEHHNRLAEVGIHDHRLAVADSRPVAVDIHPVAEERHTGLREERRIDPDRPEVDRHIDQDGGLQMGEIRPCYRTSGQWHQE
jgi:hypothetical protein